MRATVVVFLKSGVLDVQGKAIEGALAAIGFSGVSDVRVGRTLTFDLAAADPTTAKAQVERMCERLLANTVIESFRVEVG